MRTGVGREAAACLKEVLDRTDLPPEETWPDADQVAMSGLKRWTIPDTEISLVRINERAREGEFLFSSDTVNRVSGFYELVKALPYQQRQEVTPGLYQLYLSEPGWLLPRIDSFASILDAREMARAGYLAVGSHGDHSGDRTCADGRNVRLWTLAGPHPEV